MATQSRAKTGEASEEGYRLVAHKKSGLRFISGGRSKPAGRVQGIGQIFEAEVLALADTGNGVVEHPDGRRVFVPGAWPGERVRVKIVESKAQYAIGELVEVLAASPARMVLINLEDLWGETEPQNVPGTHDERPNWRRKARYTFEELSAQPEVVDVLRRVDEIRKEGGR